MKRTAAYLILIAVTGLIAYANTFHVPFAFDDVHQIENNPLIKGIDTFILEKKEHFAYNARRYVGYFTFALNYQFGGLEVSGYHIANLSIHLINALLVYWLVLLTFRTPFFHSEKLAANSEKDKKENERLKSDASSLLTIHYSQFIALFSALLFVSHPLQTQAVTYIAQRFTSLATLFYLSSVVLYIKARLKSHSAESTAQSARDNPQGTGAPRSVFSLRGPTPYALCSLLFAGLAIMTKEISFTLPVVGILYEFIFFKPPLKRKLLLMIPVILTFVIIAVIVMGTQRPLGELLSDLSERTRVQTDISRVDYFLTQLRVITTYVRLLFLPVNQNVDYDYPIARSPFTPSVFLSFLFLVSLLGAAVYLVYKAQGARRKAQSAENSMPYALGAMRLAGFGIFWFFITLSVESSFIPIADVIFEHRVYLPSVGAFIGVVALLFVMAGRLREGRKKMERMIIIGLTVTVMIFSLATLARNRVWLDEVRLWEDVVKKSPYKARGYNNLGYVYLGRDMTDQAITHIRTALQFSPRNADARNNLGVAYYRKGWLDAAIEQFRISFALGSSDFERADSLYNLGIAYAHKGMNADALAVMESASKFSPNSPEIYSDLGVLYMRVGEIDKAVGSYQHALSLAPDYAPAHFNLGMIYREKGMKGAAEEHLRRARELDPKRF
jgi:Flp pilus assembly protein TadD